jgi:hypothetical protein
MYSKETESEVKHNDERNPYRRKSKTEMAADGRNECDLGSPYRETERLPGWLHEYSHRSGRRRTEESRIKREGMAENALLERAVNSHYAEFPLFKAMLCGT